MNELLCKLYEYVEKEGIKTDRGREVRTGNLVITNTKSGIMIEVEDDKFIFVIDTKHRLAQAVICDPYNEIF